MKNYLKNFKKSIPIKIKTVDIQGSAWYHVNMQEYYGDDTVTPINVRFGMHDGAKDFFKEIINIHDENQRKLRIDEYITLMESDAEKNGFFGRDDVVSTGDGGFKLDDPELYYLFFNKVANKYNVLPVERKKLMSVISDSIRETQNEYFGAVGSGNLSIRENIVNSIGREITSIQEIKGKECAFCAESAAVSHNLWLMSGVKSYWIESYNFLRSGQHESSSGHAYNIIEQGGKFILYDLVMRNICVMSGDPIETIKQSKPLIIDYAQNPAIYANANLLNTFSKKSIDKQKESI